MFPQLGELALPPKLGDLQQKQDQRAELPLRTNH